MDFSTNLLGKKLTDLQYVDIERFFIDDKDESDIIEFKSFNVTHGTVEQTFHLIKHYFFMILHSILPK